MYCPSGGSHQGCRPSLGGICRSRNPDLSEVIENQRWNLQKHSETMYMAAGSFEYGAQGLEPFSGPHVNRMFLGFQSADQRGWGTSRRRDPEVR